MLARLTGAAVVAGRTGRGLQSPGRPILPFRDTAGTEFDGVKSYLPANAAVSPRRTEMNFSSASFDFFPKIKSTGLWRMMRSSSVIFPPSHLFSASFPLTPPCFSRVLCFLLSFYLQYFFSFRLHWFIHPSCAFLSPSHRLPFLSFLPSFSCISYTLLCFLSRVSSFPCFHSSFFPLLLYVYSFFSVFVTFSPFTPCCPSFCLPFHLTLCSSCVSECVLLTQVRSKSSEGHICHVSLIQ